LQAFFLRRKGEVFSGGPMIEQLQKAIESTEGYQKLRLAPPSAGEPWRIGGVAGSMKPLIIGSLYAEQPRPFLVIASDPDDAERMRDDLSLVVGAEKILWFGGRSPDDVHALRSLAMRAPMVTVSHPAMLLLDLPPPAGVAEKSVTLHAGSEMSLTGLHEMLHRFGFERKEFVESCGDYAVRGGILDVFPFVGENPLRVEFSGETIESLREFDPLSQRSIRELSIAVIVPNLLAPHSVQEPQRYSLLDYAPPEAVLVVNEPELVRASYEQAAVHRAGSAQSFEEVESLLNLFPCLHLFSARPREVTVDLGGKEQPSFNSSIAQLRRNLALLQAEGYRIMLVGESPAESARLRELLSTVPQAEEAGSESRADPDLHDTQIEFQHPAFHAGFSLPAARIAVYTEHQIFNRLKRRGRRRGTKAKGITDRELAQLRKGDYVVHDDFGIGRFDGLKRIRVGTAEQEVVKVVYAEQDTLYVHLNYISRLRKYSSKEGHVPKLTRLGSAEWDRLKLRTRKRVKDIARDLIRLYAKRRQSPGHAFQPDTPWQKELEASFLYDDTFDQARATLDVKQDMETPVPMDRLICGDVGFGKTEVAVRAAFKAVLDGRQVAVLVPTTILAVQHFNTFVDRLARYGVQMRVISRFKPRGEQQQTLSELEGGSIDVIIGTHRLLSKDVTFKNLGLLIIDEEHRFGVAAKESLRRMRAEVDTLALTATPIPRTLHFSLLGARDLSIIATAPKNRLPIITEITQWSPDLVRETVLKELHRGGQVYFVHDRIQTIDQVAEQLRVILPGIRIAVGHGQMHAHELEKVMLDFLEKRVDLLLSTKIIESGLDIPNVNTILINRADRFGMAELYQLRGRVGRSNVQAYAYLLVPPVSVLPPVAIKRLQALQEFNELGSGFNLAMRDLEIRGAGNLLGAEQSGFIESLGFETYTRIVEDAVRELKEEEFRDLLTEGGRQHGARRETIVEPRFDALIPEEYIGAEVERLAIYRRLYLLTTRAQLDECAEELRDRFGKFPAPVERLFGVVRLRLEASRAGFLRVGISETEMEIEFPPEDDRGFYEGAQFQQMMQTIGGLKGSGVTLRQQGKALKLHVSFPSYSSDLSPIEAASNLLKLL
jgi:transcription-repair coupling factor (superfamily II helicase)